MAQKQHEQKADVKGFDAIIGQWRTDPSILLQGSALNQSNNFVSISNLLDFLKSPPPKAGTSERKTYDAAIEVIGQGQGLGGAINFLQNLHVNLLTSLSESITSRASIGSDAAAELLPVLLAISNDPTNPIYGGPKNLAAMTTLFTNLSKANDLAEPGTANIEFPTVNAVVTASSDQYVALETMRQNERVVIDTHGSGSVADPQAAMTTQLIQAAGGNEQAAGTFLSATAQAAKSLAPNTSQSSRDAAANGLLDSLSAFENNDQVNYAPDNPSSPFRAAQTALRNGDIEGALTELNKINDLASVLHNLNNISVVTVEKRALNRVYGNVTVSIKFSNNAEWEEARENPTGAKFMWATRLDAGFYYGRVAYQGTQKTYEIQYPGTLDTTGKVKLNPDPQIRQLSGQGNDFSVPLALYLSGIKESGTPYHIIFYTQPGVRTWALDKVDIDVVIPKKGDKPEHTEKRTIDLKKTSFVLGPTGVEFNLPGKTGYERFRISGFGAYFTGTADSPNFVDNISLFGKIQGTYPGDSSGFAMIGSARVDVGINIPGTTDSTAIDSKITVPLSIRAEPINFVFRKGDHVFMFGPTGELVTEFTGKEGNRLLLSGAFGGTATWLLKDTFELNLRAGAAMNEGSYKATDLTPYVGLNVTIPWDFGGASRVVPSKVAESQDLSAIYGTALSFSHNPPNLLNSAMGEAIAKKTAFSLAQSISVLPIASEINRDPNCQAALLLLSQGNFPEGFAYLEILAAKFPETFTSQKGRGR